MHITFCCTNLDLYTLDEFRALERMGLDLETVHCLGLCHLCAQGKMALVEDAIVVADDAAAFWQAVRSLCEARGGKGSVSLQLGADDFLGKPFDLDEFHRSHRE